MQIRLEEIKGVLFLNNFFAIKQLNPVIAATKNDRQLVVDILSSSFADNASVNYIIKQDRFKYQRLRKLMEYTFDVCTIFGKALLSDDRVACALMIFPENKTTTPRKIMLDIKLIISCIGILNLKKALTRESRLKKLQPTQNVYYLWFIGVRPERQKEGAGTRLLNEIIDDAKKCNRTMYLETSNLKNLPWYRNFGFNTYAVTNFGYDLYFLKKET